MHENTGAVGQQRPQAPSRSAGHETCHHRIYSLTCEAYERLLARAGGRCELCAVPASAVYRGKLLIDHEGRIGWHAVRGMVCPKCNAHMRRVDSGERPIAERELAYLKLSGHALPQGRRPVQTIRPRQRTQQRKSPVPRQVVREFIAWYRREPGARLPQRPPKGRV